MFPAEMMEYPGGIAAGMTVFPANRLLRALNPK
jgi:hypothetical protein